MRIASFLMAVFLVSYFPQALRGDVWDIQAQNDDTVATHNELVHGSDQFHDLAARPGPLADQDWYNVSTKPWASYEVVVDATSGDIGAPSLRVYDSTGTIMVAEGTAIGNGFSKSVRWRNDSSTALDQRVRVLSGNCTTNCNGDDVYRLRMFETTAAIPRFNNAAGQSTVLILQNAATYSIDAKVFFWNANGTQLGYHGPITISPKALVNLNTDAALPNCAGCLGAAGSITLWHTGRHGDLVGKGFSLDTDTGFSFDTPIVSRPR